MRYPLLRVCHIFGRSGGGASTLTLKKQTFFWHLWAHLHNLIKQNYQFFNIKENRKSPINPLLNSLLNPLLIPIKKVKQV